MPIDSETIESTLKLLSKAYDTYKDFDDAKEDQEKKLADAFDRIPLNRVAGADPVWLLVLFHTINAIFSLFYNNLINFFFFGLLLMLGWTISRWKSFRHH